MEDNGEGIREEDLPRVFDPYFSTKSSGSGLGLPLSKRIVEQHHGTILIESRPGQGSVVTVSVPVESEGAIDG